MGAIETIASQVASLVEMVDSTVRIKRGKPVTGKRLKRLLAKKARRKAKRAAKK